MIRLLKPQDTIKRTYHNPHDVLYITHQDQYNLHELHQAKNGFVCSAFSPFLPFEVSDFLSVINLISVANVLQMRRSKYGSTMWYFGVTILHAPSYAVTDLSLAESDKRLES